jgi:hypothetical protein
MTRRITVAKDVPVIRIDVGDGDWVEAKAYLLLRDREKINSRLATVRQASRKANQPNESQVNINLDHATTLTLLQTIIAWGGPGFCVVNHDEAGMHEHNEGQADCKAIAITEETLGNLDEDTARLIVERVRDRYPVPEPPDPKDPETPAMNGGDTSNN